MVTRRLTAVSALLAQDPAERERLAGAMREAVLNAILHADYFSRGGLAILRTAGKLTVSNGGLPRVDPDQARQGAAGDPRNRGLVALFALLKLATGTGRGAGIYALWAQQGWQAPVLAEAAHAERTDLSLPLPPPGLFPGGAHLAKQILEYLTDHVSAAPRTLAQGLGLSLREVQGALAQLTRQNLVVPQGGLPGAGLTAMRRTGLFSGRCAGVLSGPLLLHNGLQMHQQVHLIVDFKLFIDVGDVGADGIDADVELLRDLLVLHPGREVVDDPPLLLG